MIIVLHVGLAIGSLLYSTFVFFRPTWFGLRLSYGLIGAALASGTYLVFTTHAPLTQACLNGVAYMGATFSATLTARYKLVHSHISSKHSKGL